MNEQAPQPHLADASHEQPTAPLNRETVPRPSPRIYVASLSDYNDGRLHGEWIDADRDAVSIHTAIQAMLARSRDAGAEEFAIHDYDNFGVYRVEEYATIEHIAWIASGIKEFGPAFAAWATLVGDDLDRLGDFSTAYLGQFDSLTAYAEQQMDELGYNQELDRLSSTLRPYVSIRADQLARDLEAEGAIDTVAAPDGGVWVFDANV